MYVADFLSFVSLEVGLFNVAAVLLNDLDIYIVGGFSPPSRTAIMDEPYLSFLSHFCGGRDGNIGKRF